MYHTIVFKYSLIGRYNEQIDVFSLGVLIVQMISGEYPRIDRREEQLTLAADAQPIMRSVMTSSLDYLPYNRPTASKYCTILKGICDNDRYYSPARLTAPQCDIGILARRWLGQQIDDRCKDIKTALDTTGRRLIVEEGAVLNIGLLSQCDNA